MEVTRCYKLFTLFTLLAQLTMHPMLSLLLLLPLLPMLSPRTLLIGCLDSLNTRYTNVQEKHCIFSLGFRIW